MNNQSFFYYLEKGIYTSRSSLYKPPVLAYRTECQILWGIFGSFDTHRCSSSRGCGSVMQGNWCQWSWWSSLAQCHLWLVSRSCDPTATQTTTWYLQVQPKVLLTFSEDSCLPKHVGNNLNFAHQVAVFSLIHSAAAQHRRCVTPQGAAAGANTGAI